MKEIGHWIIERGGRLWIEKGRLPGEYLQWDQGKAARPGD